MISEVSVSWLQYFGPVLRQNTIAAGACGEEAAHFMEAERERERERDQPTTSSREAPPSNGPFGCESSVNWSIDKVGAFVSQSPLQSASSWGSTFNTA
jgi:hypothetical protein